MAIKLKIFKVLFICILMASPAFGIKILKPGDIVKGKTLTEVFYCLDEKETNDFLNAKQTIQLLEGKLELKDQQIENCETTIEIMMTQIEGKNELRDVMKEAYNESRDREKELHKVAEEQNAEAQRQRRRADRMFSTGGLFGGGVVAAIVYLVKGAK